MNPADGLFIYQGAFIAGEGFGTLQQLDVAVEEDGQMRLQHKCPVRADAPCLLPLKLCFGATHLLCWLAALCQRCLGQKSLVDTTREPSLTSLNDQVHVQSDVSVGPPFDGIAAAAEVDAEQLDTLQMRSCTVRLTRRIVAHVATKLRLGALWARSALCFLLSQLEEVWTMTL